MAYEGKGVGARGHGSPATIETILVPDPGPGEAVVKVQACGVCHTDLHYREGGINDDFPFLLGHEAAGVVESGGPDVPAAALRRPRVRGAPEWRGGRRPLPSLQPRGAVVLLRDAQRHPAHDPGR